MRALGNVGAERGLLEAARGRACQARLLWAFSGGGGEWGFRRFLTHYTLPPGSRLSKVYSQSTLSLSTVANEAPNHLGVKRPTSR